MFDDLTWDAILRAWPWFAAAATVFVVAAPMRLKRKAPAAPRATSAGRGTLSGKSRLPAVPRAASAGREATLSGRSRLWRLRLEQPSELTWICILPQA